jgi:hypothetical protein
MTVLEIYAGSNGDATRALYQQLEAIGPIGVVAVNLFRAQKASARAKVYRGGGYRGAAYEKKDWSLQNLCRALVEHGDKLAIEWGWREDPAQSFHRWVLYVVLPTGQVSFHASQPHSENRFAGDWDGTHLSQERIVRFVQSLVP